MKYLVSILALALILFIVSCGEKADEFKQGLENMKKLADAGKNMEKEFNAAQKKREERAKKGDTIAIHYQELQKYLPETISGYTAQEPQGQSVNSGIMSISTCSRRYEKQGGGDYITIELADYNQAGEMFTGLTSLWIAGFSFESNETLEKTFGTGIDGVVGYEKYGKINKEANLNFAISWRFLLNIQANNQSNTDFVKKIANSIDIKKLAGM